MDIQVLRKNIEDLQAHFIPLQSLSPRTLKTWCVYFSENLTEAQLERAVDAALIKYGCNHDLSAQQLVELGRGTPSEQKEFKPEVIEVEISPEQAEKNKALLKELIAKKFSKKSLKSRIKPLPPEELTPEQIEKNKQLLEALLKTFSGEPLITPEEAAANEQALKELMAKKINGAKNND